jgi:hypothetical protein
MLQQASHPLRPPLRIVPALLFPLHKNPASPCATSECQLRPPDTHLCHQRGEWLNRAPSVLDGRLRTDDGWLVSDLQNINQANFIDDLLTTFSSVRCSMHSPHAHAFMGHAILGVHSHSSIALGTHTFNTQAVRVNWNENSLIFPSLSAEHHEADHRPPHSYMRMGSIRDGDCAVRRHCACPPSFPESMYAIFATALPSAMGNFDCPVACCRLIHLHVGFPSSLRSYRHGCNDARYIHAYRLSLLSPLIAC